MNSASFPLRLLRPAIVTALLLVSDERGAALAQGTALGGSIAIASDYTFRGVSQTLGAAALQASVDLTLASGFHAGVWASNVDFVPDDEPDDGARLEVDVSLGYAANLGDDWSIDIGLTRYSFPGADAGVGYDYTELLATAVYGGRYTATVGLSGDVDGTGAASRFYSLGTEFELPAGLGLAAALGHYDLSDAYGSRYSYVEASLSRQVGNAGLTVTYVDTSGSADSIYGGRVTGPRLVLTLNVDW